MRIVNDELEEDLGNRQYMSSMQIEDINTFSKIKKYNKNNEKIILNRLKCEN